MQLDILLFSGLLFLFIYIAALVGMEFYSQRCKFDIHGDLIEDLLAFQKAKDPDQVHFYSPRDNFDTIYNSMTTVFVVILGEDWPGIMYNYVRSSGSYEPCIYFLITYSAGNFILMSLFTAILLAKFENEDDDGEGFENDDAANSPDGSHSFKSIEGSAASSEYGSSAPKPACCERC
jgi:hypothetical protein